jgi:hypothetical protein
MRKKLVVAFALVVVLASAALAAWNASGSGGSVARAGAMPAGNTPTASPTLGDVTVSWAASTMFNGDPVDGYVVKRYDTATSAPATILTSCTGVISGLTCTENGVPDGAWQYTITPQKGNWLGAESGKSSSVVVVNVPAPELTSSTPASPSNSPVDPTINGTALAGTTVKIYTNSTCTSSVAGSGVATGGSFAVTVPLVANASTDYYGAATDALDNTSSCSSTFVEYTHDDVSPVVSSTVRADPSPTNASSVHFTVTFSEPVTGVDATDFSLTTAGLSGGSIATVTGSGATRTVTVGAGSGDGSLRLDVSDDDSVVDTTGNELGGPGTGNGAFVTGQAYAVDKTFPTVSSISRADGDPSNAAIVNYNVTFSESVAGVDLSDFSLATSGVSGASLSSITGSGATRNVAIDTGTNSGSIRLDLADDDSVMDDAANSLGGTGTGNGNFTGQTYTIDRVVPSVTSIDRVNSDPSGASTVNFAVTFSESVTGVDSTDFALATTGLTGASISSVSGAGATRNVAVATGSGGGSIGLNLVDDDSIADAATNSLAGSGIGNGNFTGQVYTVDKTAPTVQSIVRGTPSVANTNATSVTFIVTFTEPVSGVDGADFNLSPTVTGASISSISTNALSDTRTVTVGTGTGDGQLALNVGDDDSIVDGAANKLGNVGLGNGNFTTGERYTIDKTPPAVSSIDRQSPATASSNTQSLAYLVTFNDNVTGVDASDFTLTTTGSLSGASIASVSTDSSSGTRTVTVDSGTGDGTIRLNLVDDDSITDAATNKLGGAGVGNGNFNEGQTYTIDKTVPTVVSINRTAASPTNASSVSFAVTFSEPVSGVNTTAVDFGLATSGVTSASITSSTVDAGATRTVTVATGSGDGTIGLNLVDDDSIVDAVGNKLGGTGLGNGSFTGQSYVIDKSAPVVTAQTPTSVLISGTGSTQITWSATEAHLTGGAYQVRVGGTTCTTGTALANTNGNSNVAGGYTSSGANVSSTIAAASLAEGANTIRFCVSDDAVNAGNDTKSVTKDSTAPTVTSTAGPTPAILSSGSSTITWSAADANLGTGIYQIRVGGTNCTDGTALANAGLNNNVTGSYTTSGASVVSSIDVASLNEGANTVRVCTVDSVGNVGSLTKAITKDTTAPVVTAGAPSSSFVSAGTTTIAWSANDSNLTGGTYQVRVGGADCTDGTPLPNTGGNLNVVGNYTVSGSSVTSTIAPASLSEGANIVRVCVMDQVVNRGFDSKTVTKDTVVPVVTVGAPTSALVNATGSTQVTWSATDLNLTAGTYQLRLNATTCANGTVLTNGSGNSNVVGAYTISGTNVTSTIAGTSMTPDGTFTIKICVSDSAANSGNANATASVQKDGTVPIAAAIAAANKPSGGTVGTIESGDTLTFTYSEVMSLPSIAAAWNGASTSVTLQFTDGRGSNDSATVTVDSNSNPVSLGTVALGSIDFIKGGTGTPATLTFTGSTMTQATVSSKTVVTVTLGTTTATACPGSIVTTTPACIAANPGNNKLVWTPASGATDIAGNPSSLAPLTGANLNQF